MPRAANYAKTFLKDWDPLFRSGRYAMNRPKQAMVLLMANDEPLGPEWLCRALNGPWQSLRECHIGGDFLLAYKLDDTAKAELIVFVRAGSYADLFSD